eukprot:6196348-Pleurochrysis_carterae.AAC.1
MTLSRTGCCCTKHTAVAAARTMGACARATLTRQVPASAKKLLTARHAECGRIRSRLQRLMSVRASMHKS